VCPSLCAGRHRELELNAETRRRGMGAGRYPLCGSESAGAEAEAFALTDALAVAPVLALSCTRRTSRLLQTFMLLHQGLSKSHQVVSSPAGGNGYPAVPYLDETSALKGAHLLGDGLPGGEDHVRQVLMRAGELGSAQRHLRPQAREGAAVPGIGRSVGGAESAGYSRA
jgi:hypothetical protein